VVVYFHPRTGLPDQEPPGGSHVWNSIPGARGCTPQACSYRDHYKELKALGAEVFGVSTQDTEYQLEAAERLTFRSNFSATHDANSLTPWRFQRSKSQASPSSSGSRSS
jgi:peroxiredoxin